MKTVLIVEGSRQATRIMEKALIFQRRSTNLTTPRVISVTSFDDAVDQLKSKEIDVVSSAMVFPLKYGDVAGNSMGRFLVHKIRQDYPEILVVLFSAEKVRDLEVNSFPPDRVLHKGGPETYKAWADKISELLGE